MNPNEGTPEQYIVQSREKIREMFGVAISTLQKDGGTTSLSDQVEVASTMEIPAIQFDFRNRTIEEIQEGLEALLQYRSAHPDVVISIHGDTPKIDETDISIQNHDRLLEELKIVQELIGESYTVHPPSVQSKLFESLSPEVRATVIDRYAAIFCGAITAAYAQGKKFSVAIENMSAQGEEGAWGQKVEDILFLIQKIEKELIAQGVDPIAAHEYVGATLDVNHALYEVNVPDYQTILETWFKGLGDYLKVIHLYTPSALNTKFSEKYRLCLDLAAQYSPHARLLMESKQDTSVTTKVYAAARQIE